MRRNQKHFNNNSNLLTHGFLAKALLCIFFVSPISSPNAHCEKPFDFPAEILEVGGKRAFLLEPTHHAQGKPWVWFAPTLKTGDKVLNFPNKNHAFYFGKLLEQGISVAGIDLGEVRGSPDSTQMFKAFYDAMVERGFSSKPVLLGQSRGGLMLLAFAVQNPAKISAFAGIYPVLNLSSFPLKGKQVAITLEDYRLSFEELSENLEKYNPIKHIDRLTKERVPVFIVHGDSDKIVPWKDNGDLLIQEYQRAGVPIEHILVTGKGHEVIPEFFECSDLSRFVVKHALAAPQTETKPSPL